MIERLKEVIHYRKNLDAQRRIDEIYLSERDPEGIDFVSFDPYTDNLAHIVYEAKKHIDKPQE